MLLYDFTLLSDGKTYQVRLAGQLVTYTEKKSPDAVDAILKENGFRSRDQFFKSRLDAKIHREAAKQAGEVMGQYAIENAKMKAALNRIKRGNDAESIQIAASCLREIYGGDRNDFKKV